MKHFAGIFLLILAASVRAAAPDMSTPEKTWVAVCAAVNAEDVTAFRACFYNSNEIARLFMAAYSDMTVTSFKLANTVALIGPEGKELSVKLQAVYTDLVASGRNRKTEIKLDAASWSRTEVTPDGNTQKVIYFKKVGANWLIDTERSYSLDEAEGRKAAETFLKQSEVQLPLVKKIIVDIQNNKIHSLDELHKRMAGGI